MLMSLSIYLKNEKKHLNRSQFMSFLCCLLGATEKKYEKKRKKTNKPSSGNIWRKREIFSPLCNDRFFFLFFLFDTHTQPWVYG